MDADTLLRRIAPLPFPERRRSLAEHARTAAGSPSWPGLLLDLQQRGRYERRCALLMAAVAGDLDHVRGALVIGGADERDHALGLAVRLGLPAAEITALLPQLSRVGRQNLFRALRRDGTAEVADAVLPAVRAAFGDVAAAAVLPACSAPVIAAGLGDLGWAVTAWSALGRRHPHLVLDHVDAVLAGSPRTLWTDDLARFGAGLGAATVHDPERVLALVERCAPDVAVPGQVLDRAAVLARHDPARVAAVLLRPGSRFAVGRALVEALAPLRDDVLGRVLAALPAHGRPRFLRHLPPSRRAAVHRHATDDSVAATAVEVLDLLPAPERHTLARRALTRHDVADHPARRLAVLARAPFAEAQPELAALTREPTAERRALGYTLLLAAAGATRDPEVVAQVLTGLTRLPREQDPVRVAAVRAVADLPARLLTPAAAAAAVTVVADAVAAPDASWPTRSGAASIAAGLLGEGLVGARPDLVDSGLAATAVLTRAGHGHLVAGFARVLPPAADPLLFDALAPEFDARARVGAFDGALTFADRLGAVRTARLPGLEALVASATRAKDDHVVRRAVTLWLAPSATRDERVAQVLADDRTTITIGAVAEAVAARRTDLLDTALRATTTGRFLARRLRYLPAIGQFSDRWNPGQVALFRSRAADLAGDSRVTAQQRLAGIGQLRSVPGSAAEVRRLGSDPDPVIAEAALVALGTLAAGDDPAGVVPDLVAAAATDRSRAVVPALRRCLDRMPPAQVDAPLRALLVAPKVTVRKDAVRLVVDLATPDAMGILRQVWDSPTEHRDVRRAVPASLRTLLDDERAWEVLAAAGADPVTASAVLDVSPLVVPPSHRARWAGEMLVVARAADDVVARAALDALHRWIRFAPAAAAVTLAAVVTDLGRTGRWRAALPGLVQCAAIMTDPAPVVDVVRDLLRQSGSPADVDAGEDRDRPVRQRLVALTAAVAARSRAEPALRAHLAGLIDALAADATRDLAIEVAVAGVDWDADPAAALTGLTVLADRPLLAVAAAAAVARGLRPVVGALAPAALDAALAVLPADGSSTAALLRVAVVEVAGDAAGWPPRWRDRLREVRRHPDPDVARAAAAVLTAPE